MEIVEEVPKLPFQQVGGPGVLVVQGVVDGDGGLLKLTSTKTQ